MGWGRRSKFQDEEKQKRAHEKARTPRPMDATRPEPAAGTRRLLPGGSLRPDRPAPGSCDRPGPDPRSVPTPDSAPCPPEASIPAVPRSRSPISAGPRFPIPAVPRPRSPPTRTPDPAGPFLFALTEQRRSEGRGGERSEPSRAQLPAAPIYPRSPTRCHVTRRHVTCAVPPPT